MQVIVDGMMTHYERAGQGPIILIIPGWADTSASWLPMQRSLSQSFDIIIIDTPGFAGSQAPNTAWDLNDYADFIQHFLQKLEVHPYAIIGHSNGGSIALRLLGTNRIPTDKLVLLASAGIREKAPKKSALTAVTKIGKIVSTPLPANIKRRLRAQLYKSVGSDMLVAEHMEETFKKIVNDDVRSDASKISVPTLLVYGDADTDAPVAFGREFHELIDSSRLEVIPGAGHFLHTEQTADVVHIMKGFLK